LIIFAKHSGNGKNYCEKNPEVILGKIS
jgi:hypothetical protein